VCVCVCDREAPKGEAMTPIRIEGLQKNSVYFLRASMKHLTWLQSRPSTHFNNYIHTYLEYCSHYLKVTDL